ncbi:asparagine synthetase domain-containing protein 1 isoform X1 [Nilaparvata lugens]|uniref:asparagine synthetase domain-containing protein 1 isoform X1 n=1 Tax=Nilaparvata lugens TaxID=108931 RepID=UPI00193D68B5|nr:asparagine synthetase domain-containing protein 1 isoform X1 [Nilaparvata lugens]
MCGIFLYLVKNGDQQTDDSKLNVDSIHELLSNRGPDSRHELKLNICDWSAHFVGHVLHTQGQSICRQPLTNENGHILLWNGDVFNDSYVTEDECDTTEVFKNMNRDGVLHTVSELTGPFAFIYYNSDEQSVWFGRDVIGRHSLLWSVTADSILITSVAGVKRDFKFTEVPSKGIFKLNLETQSLDFHPWSHSEDFCPQSSENVPIIKKTSVRHFLIDSFANKDTNPQDVEAYTVSTNKNDEFYARLLANSEVLPRVEKFIDILSKSIKVRTEKQPKVCKLCINTRKEFWPRCNHSKLGILFSGGLDSTVLALLADKFVPPEDPIDLFNVAFQNPTKSTVNFSVPDRETGLSSLKELQSLCPKRTWNFVKIDVPFTELMITRVNHISDLIHPLDTVLDDSLGCAVWFAARGSGVLLRDNEFYTSPARVVLLGMGVDELLGGYTRHRTEWRRSQSWEQLGDTLATDVARIGHRNLGRDNRVVCDHGRQPRTPYLDERLVAYVLSLHPSKRCYLSDTLPVGVGDKLLLRLVAWKLGLRNCATLPKRAMQFGSRIANSKEKGSQVCDRL